jgi:hypothetical protein
VSTSMRPIFNMAPANLAIHAIGLAALSATIAAVSLRLVSVWSDVNTEPA